LISTVDDEHAIITETCISLQLAFEV
jgi:hypothetical protein